MTQPSNGRSTWLAPAVVIALALACVPPAFAAPSCVVANRLTGGGLRSADNRGLIVSVYDDTIDPSVDLTNLGLISISNPQFSVESVALLAGQRISITLTLLPTYIGKLNPTTRRYVNDTSLVTVAPQFFVGRQSCTFTFSVSPSAGTIDASNIPVGLSEIDINTRDIVFTIRVQFDAFMIPFVRTVRTPSREIRLLPTFSASGPNSQVTIRIPRNESYNLPFGTSEVITFIFPKEQMQTGVAPLTDPSGFTTSISLSIAAAVPLVSVTYPNADGILHAEDLWDGTGSVILSLLGDTWVRNSSLWTQVDTSPNYVASPPIQQFAWQYFIVKGLLQPTIVVTSRNVYMKFPPMPGFTLSNQPVTSLQLSGFNALASEHTAIDQVSIRVAQARPFSVRVTWGGLPFRRSITEVDVRKSGFSFFVDIKYNIFAQPLNAFNLKSMIFRTKAGVLDTDAMVVTAKTATRLNVTFPPQSTYDISTNDLINVTVPASITETRITPQNPSSGFTLWAFRKSSTCSLTSQVFLDETLIRDVSGPPLYVSISIASGGDQFCTTTASMNQLMSSLTFQSSGLGETVTPKPLPVQPPYTSIVFEILKDPNFQISQNNFMSFTLPSSLMCSLEPCVASPLTSADRPTYLQIALRTTPGTLYATFPNITEEDMRVTDYVVDLHLVGDTFVSAGASSGTTQFQFLPQFAVSPTDVNSRAFFASIFPQIRATSVVSNASYAQLVIPRNASYDCQATETIQIAIDASLVVSKLRPIIAANAFVINLVRGTIIGSILRNVTVTESDFILGKFGFTATVSNGLFVGLLVGLDARSSFSASATADPVSGALPFLGTWLSDAAFSLNFLRNVLSVNFQPVPAFDIIAAETFQLSFSGSSLSTGVDPANNTFGFTVVPSPGKVVVAGTATFAGTVDVVRGGLEYVLTLENDLWAEQPNFVRSDFCVLSPACSVILDTVTRRNVTVIFDVNPAWSFTANTTVNITLRGAYFRSGQVPVGAPSLFIYVTSGQVSWAFETTVARITEDRIREGTLPLIIAGVAGDSFSVPVDVRSALRQGVSCIGTNDQYGFCARSAVLFQGLDFGISTDSKAMRARLQADALYDIFEPETVTLRLDGVAFQSRLTPNASYSLTFTIYPTNGQFLISGTTTGITEATLRSPELAGQVTIVIALYGERWLPNATLALAALLPDRPPTAFVSNTPRQTDTTTGWEIMQYVVLNPSASATLDSTNRVLTLSLLAAPGFRISGPRFVTISVFGAAVRSGLQPNLGSLTSGFSITKAPGSVVASPSIVSAATMRATGANITFSISGAQWLVDVIARTPLASFITAGSTPIEEPHGFAKARDAILSSLSAKGPAVVTSDILTIPLLRDVTYRLVKPEFIYLTANASWTVDSVGISSAAIPVRFDPDYPLLTFVIDTATDQGVIDLSFWSSAVARALGVAKGQVLLDSSSPSPVSLSPQPRRFYTITIRVSYDGADATVDNPIPYDNLALQTLLNFDAGYLQRTFNCVKAFYNDSQPPATYFMSLGSAQQVVVAGPAIGAAGVYLLAFAGALFVVFLGIYVWTRYTAGSNRTSLRWAAGQSEGGGQDERKAAHALETEQERLAKAAEVLYAGQRALLPMVAGKSVGAISVSDGVHAAVTLGTQDDHDDGGRMTSLDLELPWNMYAGQSTSAASKAKADAQKSGRRVIEVKSYADRLQEHVLHQQPAQPTAAREWPSPPQPGPAARSSAAAVQPTRDNIWADVLAEDEAQRPPPAVTREMEYLSATTYRPAKSKFLTGDYTDYSIL